MNTQIQSQNSGKIITKDLSDNQINSINAQKIQVDQAIDIFVQGPKNNIQVNDFDIEGV